MDNTDNTNINLVVDDEELLYTPFNPDPEFSEPVKAYVRSRMAVIDYKKDIKLTVISRDPLDERRFKAAVYGWISDEKKKYKNDEKNLFRLFVGMLVFGSIMIVCSLNLVKLNETIQYTILPILGSFALGRAVRILIMEMPILKAQEKMIDELEKNDIIVFKYDKDKDRT